MSKTKRLAYEISPPVSRYWGLASPSSVGVLTAAALVLGPRHLKSSLPGLSPETLSSVPAKIYLLAAGFAVGFGSAKSLSWLRWEALRLLFSYHGWMYDGGRSMKDKAWGFLVKLLMGPKPHETFYFQNRLPKQPLPTLDATLESWESVCKQFVTADEYEDTVQAIEAFKNSDGPKIHAYLQEKAKKEVNWVSDYWLYAAYLSCRSPLTIYSNYYASSMHSGPATQLARAANMTYYMSKYESLLAQKRIPPVMIQGTVPLCMNSYKNVFGTVRRPEEHMDTISHYDKRHIVVIRKGRYFKMDLYAKNEHNVKELLSVEEIHDQLQRIVDAVDAMGEEVLPIADLTAQNRNVWAKGRKALLKNNEKTLEDIETSMFVLSLGKEIPNGTSELCKTILAGAGGDIWYDKGFTAMMFPDGSGGMNVEHSTIDAMVYGTVKEYYLLNEKYDDNGEVLRSDKASTKSIQPPQYLNWDLSGMEKDIESAAAFRKEKADDLDLIVFASEYGKGYMKKKRLSPDGYIQMAMQLAFYRMHKEVPKTYEPSTGRFFALGRTETVHPSSPVAVQWLHAMGGNGTTREDTIKMLRDAIKIQARRRLDATAGGGCDRHLLALYCASRELGMDIPAIFLDKAWRKGFRLSTSQTPNKLCELQIPVKILSVSGGFGPTTEDGYGVSYPVYGEDIVNFSITSWKSCPETSTEKYVEHLKQAFRDMKELLQ